MKLLISVVVGRLNNTGREIFLSTSNDCEIIEINTKDDVEIKKQVNEAVAVLANNMMKDEISNAYSLPLSISATKLAD